MLSSKCAIIVSSCDKYLDVLDGFFTLFNKYWTNCEYPVYINLEQKTYVHKNTISVNSKEKSWCKRLHNVIKLCETEYVILLLEDFYFEGPVHKEMIGKCIEEMDKNKNIISFSFKPIAYDKDNEFLLVFQKRKRFGKYRHCLQAGIWRKDYLLNTLDVDASPWEFEYTFNFLSFGKNNIFYCLNDNAEEVINCGYGLLIANGCFVKEEIDRISRNEGITFDLSARKVITEDEAKKKGSLIKRMIIRLRIIERRIKYCVFRK